MYNFDAFIDRQSTSCDKWNKEYIKEICGNENATPFWVADMDLPTSPLIKEALLNETRVPIPGYTAYPKLPINFKEYIDHKFNYTLSLDEFTYAQGMLHAIALSLNLFTKEGDEVILCFPSYQPFIHIINNNDRKLVRYLLSYEDGSFSLDIDRFIKESENCKAILLCSPHNPSGLIYPKDDLIKLLKSAKERDQLILCDEIHADLIHPGNTHYPLFTLNKEINAKCITFMAPSKTFNIAGEHFAYAIFSDKSMKEEFVKKQTALFLTSPGYFAGLLAEKLYSKENYNFLPELCSYLKENVAFIRSYLSENIKEITVTNANASFITFLDCSKIYDKVVLDADLHPEIYTNKESLLSYFFGHRAGLCFNDGGWFGKEYKSFVRFNYGTSRESIRDALDKMKEAVEYLHTL